MKHPGMTNKVYNISNDVFNWSEDNFNRVSEMDVFKLKSET